MMVMMTVTTIKMRRTMTTVPNLDADENDKNDNDSIMQPWSWPTPGSFEPPLTRTSEKSVAGSTNKHEEI